MMCERSWMNSAIAEARRLNYEVGRAQIEELRWNFHLGNNIRTAIYCVFQADPDVQFD
jgi:hypothetical protein